jgi:hypothetical protein
METSLKLPKLFFTVIIFVFVVLFAETVVSKSAHGRVTELNGTPYYVGDVAVSQMLDLPASIFNKFDQDDVDIFPLTIISTKTTRFNAVDLNRTISDFVRRDDVFSDAFLKG